jgi:hypothetical protein
MAAFRMPPQFDRRMPDRRIEEDASWTRGWCICREIPRFSWDGVVNRGSCQGSSGKRPRMSGVAQGEELAYLELVVLTPVLRSSLEFIVEYTYPYYFGHKTGTCAPAHLRALTRRERPSLSR